MYSRSEEIKVRGRKFIAIWQQREGYPERITVCADTTERPFLCILRTGALMFQAFRLMNCEWVAEDQYMGDWESITAEELVSWIDPVPYDELPTMGDFGLMKIPAEALLQMARSENDTLKTVVDSLKSIKKVLELKVQELERGFGLDEERAARIQAKALKKVDMDYTGLKERNKALKKENNRLKKEKTELLTRLNRLL